MTHRTRIKICGLRREADVAAAVEAGADAIGFVFYAKAPARHAGRCACLARALPPFVMPCCLFVNASDAELGARWTRCRTCCCSSTVTKRRCRCERAQRPVISGAPAWRRALTC